MLHDNIVKISEKKKLNSLQITYPTYFWIILLIYFFCVKRQAKNNFLKDVKSTVGFPNPLLYGSPV